MVVTMVVVVGVATYTFVSMSVFVSIYVPMSMSVRIRENDVIALNNDTHNAETRMRLNVIKERERLEDDVRDQTG